MLVWVWDTQSKMDITDAILDAEWETWTVHQKPIKIQDNKGESCVRIISFAWTTPALLKGEKTVTRRAWKSCPFKKGDLAQAWDKLPRAKGKRVGTIRIVSVRRVRLDAIDGYEMEKEGLSGQTPGEFIGNWLRYYKGSHPSDKIWRIEFVLLMTCGDCKRRGKKKGGRSLCDACSTAIGLVGEAE